jgi:DNA-binding FadR family transcriptional regulator
VDIYRERIGVTNPNAINGYDLRDVHEARLLVETSVVAEAARHISDNELEQLRASLQAQQAAIDDPLRFLICDREFHLTIYYASANRLLADFVVDLYTYLLDHRRRAMSKPGAIARSIKDHRAIVRSLERRDPKAVAAAFRRHITRIFETTRAIEDGRDKRSLRH